MDIGKLVNCLLQIFHNFKIFDSANSCNVADCIWERSAERNGSRKGRGINPNTLNHVRMQFSLQSVFKLSSQCCLYAGVLFLVDLGLISPVSLTGRIFTAGPWNEKDALKTKEQFRKKLQHHPTPPPRGLWPTQLSLSFPKSLMGSPMPLAPHAKKSVWCLHTFVILTNSNRVLGL